VFIKICHDELVAMMEHEGDASPRDVGRAPGPTGIMMVGLQGSGKTTTCAKLARLLEKQGKKPLLVAADMQRPAAVEQLKVLGEQHRCAVFNLPGNPVEICAKGDREAKKLGPRRHHLRHRGPPRDRRALMQELAASRRGRARRTSSSSSTR
jgi:signal recognition particle subunit SRP54